jgi:adenine C2-methylase RlmN of 23S rRNA A2503 and tRNA A37
MMLACLCVPCAHHLQDSVACGFCQTAVQYVKIALTNNETIAQVSKPKG